MCGCEWWLIVPSVRLQSPCAVTGKAYCRVSLGSESRMYEFPSRNFLFVKSEVVITSRKLGQADSTSSIRVLARRQNGGYHTSYFWQVRSCVSVYATGTKNLFSRRKLYCLLLIVLELHFLYGATYCFFHCRSIDVACRGLLLKKAKMWFHGRYGVINVDLNSNFCRDF